MNVYNTKQFGESQQKVSPDSLSCSISFIQEESITREENKKLAWVEAALKNQVAL